MKKYIREKIVRKPKSKTENEHIEVELDPPDIDLLDNRLVTIKFGKPVLDIKFGTVKMLTFMAVILIACNYLFIFYLFYASIEIINHLGYFINMVSTGEGTKLPVFQSIPPLIVFFITLTFTFFLFKLFDRKSQPKLNWYLFLNILIDAFVVFGTFIILFVIMSHIHGSQIGLHDGLVEAMNNYSNNSVYKKQIDRLQIEFQCCGSKKYDEWYSIIWYDTRLVKKSKLRKREKSYTTTDLVCEKCESDSFNEKAIEVGNADTLTGTGQILNKNKINVASQKSSKANKVTTLRSSQLDLDLTKGNTPFSCCSITSMFPCIHHNIEITGKAYLYTPEQNLSISTEGCHTKLRQKTIQVGWSVIGNLTLFILIQIALAIVMRLLQTAHFAASKFDGHSRLYTVWLIGRGTIISNTGEKMPPPVPPVPMDLMR
ncbi:uncharacterized protein [Diabrotica undecimpunctata]|uniref:uncharacterized protein n=1 Tax=Diabrotica undecimpunctata TaxID=50387 RepID=UPI003B63C6D6